MDIVDRLHGDALTHRLTDDAITEIERLRSTVAALEAERDQLRDVLWRGGFVMCDIPACNCGSWHHKYGLPERFREIADVLAEAGHELCNENGNLPIRALKSLAAERDQLRAELAEKTTRLNRIAALLKDNEPGVVYYGLEDDVGPGDHGCCGLLSYKPHAPDCWFAECRALAAKGE